ncbi:MAG: thioredoxin family protein [Candidatus Micrarchaeota archaeon]|nr:thioredoxin family protein [Candidatus Micrarchaeota archaeon]
MMVVISSAKEFLAVPFNRYLMVALLVIGAIALTISENPAATASKKYEAYVFVLPTCPHCAEQKPIIYELEKEMPEVAFHIIDASTPDGAALFQRMAREVGLDTTRLAVPTIILNKSALVGFHTKEQIRAEIEKCIAACEAGAGSQSAQQQEGITAIKEFDLPFLGRTDLTTMSLPVLAIVLGLIDGFNPCAMWVLVYLIGLLLEVGDKKKFWLIIGSFLFASGTLYFLFMTAWLNAFLLIGYMRPVMVLIGLVALGGGIVSLKEYYTTKGALECKVGDADTHAKTQKHVQDIIAQPLTIGIVFSIIVLAFVVNSVEFACSSAIPAVFTQVLAMKDISTLERYAYIVLYDIFFMIDDIIIFTMAGLAVGGGLGERYAKYCKLLGGVIMAVLGVIILFAPHLLR